MGTDKNRKKKKRLDARRKGFDAMNKNSKDGKGYHRPGSMKK